MLLITKRCTLHVIILNCCDCLLAHPYGFSISPTLCLTLWIIFSSCHITFIFKILQRLPPVIYLIKWGNTYLSQEPSRRTVMSLHSLPPCSLLSVPFSRALLQECRLWYKIYFIMYLRLLPCEPHESRDFCQFCPLLYAGTENTLGTYKCSRSIHLLNKKNPIE